ncbi:hypothetical protein D3OALGA1CA_5728 [Olavius algarvensis associated proteobacterium Delta 3]|nr:hypothetical protein D3OALGA1CA_5728 [Olavius algarvensis associated proteobacterium Delta 3]
MFDHSPLLRQWGGIEREEFNKHIFSIYSQHRKKIAADRRRRTQTFQPSDLLG